MEVVMFRCGFCGKKTEHGQKKTMRAVEKREKQYVRHVLRMDGTPTRETFVEGQGFEIVREMASCESCVKIPVVPKVHHLDVDAA